MDLSNSLHALAIPRAADVGDRSARARAEYQRANARRAAEESKPGVRSQVHRVCVVDITA